MDVAVRPKPSRLKVRAHRARLRKLGLHQIQTWVPDTRAPAFRIEARSRQENRFASRNNEMPSGLKKTPIGSGISHLTGVVRSE